MKNRTALLYVAAIFAASSLLGGCDKSTNLTPTLPTASASAGNIADIDVTENVKTALVQSESLKRFDISVVTLKGDVRLIGVVDNQTQIDEAVKIASNSKGAHTIHNELSIKK